MAGITEGLSPLEAYEALMQFAKRRGEFALRLAMHAAVPQGVQPELLHLLKRNFVPEAGDDPVVEADVLFSPLCEDLGRGYFRFDPRVRALLLENLAANYAAEPESRIGKVADFLLAYVDHYDRRTSGSQDQLWRDYLEMQRWVAFAFVNPPAAAEQLAAALENANSEGDFVARIQLGGLATALSAPLAGFSSLLNYAAGLQALELGDRRRADEFFETLPEDEIKIGNTTLRPAAQILNDWQARHPEHLAPSEPVEHVPVSIFAEAIKILRRSKDPAVRSRAARSLGRSDAPEAVIRALLKSLSDTSLAVHESCISSLVQIGTKRAMLGLATALSHGMSSEMARTAISRLKQMKQRLALITPNTSESERFLDAIRTPLLNHGYLPVLWDTVQVLEFGDLRAFDLAIINVTLSRKRLPDKQLLQLSIPVLPIARIESRVHPMFPEFENKYPSLMKTIVFDDESTLRVMLERRLDSLESKKLEPDSTPGTFEYDYFISYASADHDQVMTLNQTLSDQLNVLWGRRPRMFLDTELDTLMAEYSSERVLHGIETSALFIVFLSSSYIESKSCRRQLKHIVATVNRRPNVGVAIFKVVSQPIQLMQQPADLQQLSRYDLFGMFYGAEEDRPIPLDLENYQAVVAKLAADISLARDPQPGRTEVPHEDRSTPINVLILYGHKDQDVRAQLSRNVRVLEGEGLVNSQRDFMIAPVPGGRAFAALEEALNSYNLILLLLSPDVLTFDFVWSAELKRVVARAEDGDLTLIPIIIQPLNWGGSSLSRFQALPSHGKAIMTWNNRKKAFLDIEKGIRRVVEELRRGRRPSSEPSVTPVEERTPAEAKENLALPAADKLLNKEIVSRLLQLRLPDSPYLADVKHALDQFQKGIKSSKVFANLYGDEQLDLYLHAYSKKDRGLAGVADNTSPTISDRIIRVGETSVGMAYRTKHSILWIAKPNQEDDAKSMDFSEGHTAILSIPLFHEAIVAILSLASKSPTSSLISLNEDTTALSTLTKYIAGAFTKALLKALMLTPRHFES